MNHSQTVSFVWGVADLVRDTFKRGKYRDVILPLTVLRRLDCVPAPNKRQVLEVQARYKGKLENLDPQLRRASGFAFYNTSRYDFEKLLDDAPHIARNLRNYIAGFSPNMREVLEKFDFDHTISKLDEAGLLFQVMQRFGDPQVNLHPDVVDNAMMGTILEEPIRKFNEALNENPGEHFTPRDVVHLMVDLLIAGDEERLHTKGVVLSVYDPCCGSGGMVTIAKEHIKITVEGPLKLDFQATSERIARLDEQSAFRNLAVSRKKGAARMKDEQAGRARQAAIRELLASLPDRPFLDRDEFESALGKAARKAGVKLAAPIRKTILSALSQRNEKAQVCRDKDGSPEPDVDYRGKTPEKTPFGVRLVTAKNIKNQTIDFSLSEEYIPEDLYPTWMVRGLPAAGDVLVTTETPLGESAQISDTDVAPAQRIILLKANKKRISNDYLKYHLAGDSRQMELRTRATGPTALGIKSSHLKSTLVTIPPIAEQEEISQAIDDGIEEIDLLVAKIRDAIDRLREFRTALISAAVTGKIDVREEVA